MPSRYLNKAIIQAASDCLRLAYLRVRDRESDTAPPPSSKDRVQLMYGQMVGAKAREHFPDGELIAGTTFSAAVAETQRALKEGKITLFEAAFEFDGIGIRVDVLARHSTFTKSSPGSRPRSISRTSPSRSMFLKGSALRCVPT